jgi:hypothetical protein
VRAAHAAGAEDADAQSAAGRRLVIHVGWGYR